MNIFPQEHGVLAIHTMVQLVPLIYLIHPMISMKPYQFQYHRQWVCPRHGDTRILDQSILTGEDFENQEVP